MNSRTTKSTANLTSNIFSVVIVEHLAEPYIFKHLKMFGSVKCSTDIIEVGIIKDPYSIYHFPTISHQNLFFCQSYLLLTISFVFSSWCAQRVNPTSKFEEVTKYQTIEKFTLTQTGITFERNCRQYVCEWNQHTHK